MQLRVNARSRQRLLRGRSFPLVPEMVVGWTRIGEHRKARHLNRWLLTYINISKLILQTRRAHARYPYAGFLDHDDVIKWKRFPRYWPFVRGIHRSPVNSPHKGQWRGALMFSLICVWINGWLNNRETGNLRRYRAHYDVAVMHCLF